MRTMRNAIAFSFAAVLLAGCGQTQLGDELRSAVATRAARANDALVENAEWALCEQAAVGAIRRKYGSGDKFQAYAMMCASISVAPALQLQPAPR